MPIDGNSKCEKKEHQKNPDRNADHDLSLESGSAVCLMRLIIHDQNSQCGWNVHSIASMKIRIEATTKGA